MTTKQPYAYVKAAAIAGVTSLLLGAGYLMAVRGTAMMHDLSSMSKYWLCF